AGPLAATSIQGRISGEGTQMSTKKKVLAKVAKHSSDQPSAENKVAAMAKTGEGAHFIHSCLLPGSIYRRHMEQLVGDDEILLDSAQTYMSDLMARFQPRDVVEEMLIAQMTWTHIRLAKMSARAGIQEHVKWSQHLHEAADRAANTFRRQMLALAEY